MGSAKEVIYARVDPDVNEKLRWLMLQRQRQEPDATKQSVVIGLIESAYARAQGRERKKKR